MFKKSIAILSAAVLALGLTACSKGSSGLFSGITNTTVTVEQTQEPQNSSASSGKKSGNTASSTELETGTANETAAVNATSGGAIDTAELFTDRDLEQEADLSEAVSYTLSDGNDITITAAGVYVISGSAKNASIIVEALDDDKVQLVLDGVTIENDDFPCIYVKNADKVFVTTTDSENSLSVTGSFTADGDTNTDAVIFSKDDLVLNGTGTLNIASTDNGITGKDDLKITGGTINISCVSDALEANDSIRIAAGTISISTKKDGLHAENDDDNTLGYIYICGGTLNITAGDDGIHATTILQIDGGSLDITAGEGLEATWVQINDGTVTIKASDDGINAAKKSTICTPAVEINGGTITIAMGSGDTDGIDSNGNLIINGGTVDITGNSPYDFDGQGQYNGGTLIVNGSQVDSLSNQFMGGGGKGGQGNQGFGGKGGHGWGK